MRYQSRKDPQCALRIRLRDLAAARVRYGYRRLHVLLRREGWLVNLKRVRRLYHLEGLSLRLKKPKKRVSALRVMLPPAQRPNEQWRYCIGRQVFWLSKCGSNARPDLSTP